MPYTRFTLILLSLALSGNSYAQQPQKLTLDQATIFLSGAELQSSAKIALAKGDNEVVFTNVAGDINTASLAVSATNEVVVTSATFQNNYLTAEPLSSHAKTIKDSIEIVRSAQDELNTKIEVLKEQVAILFNNQKISGENTGLNVAELTKMLDLVNARMEGYLTQQKKEERLLAKTNERLARLKKQLEEEQKKEQPGGQLLVKLYAKEATASNITVDYVSTHAGWAPAYDIMADNISSPIRLYYKANIWQNSGIKWNNVHLALSSGNPAEGGQAPAINPEYLSFYNPLISNYSANSGMAIANRKLVIDMDRPASNIMAKDLEYAPESSINDHVAIDNAGINTSFDIDIPYTIATDGQQHLVAIKKYDLPATYRYYAIPKLDKDVFMQAQITNWQDLNLLPGKTNIFYEGTYVGEGAIDVRNTRDTMTLSMGRDKKIIVKRERDIKRHSATTIGSNQRETFAYTITIRNTRKEAISLTIQDQAPVSNDKEIVIEDLDNPGAQYEETTGALKWNISLNANETKTLTFGYTVKYPKGKVVSNLR